MSDEDALAAAIIANPDEDTPRLAYADWIQEHGSEDRAELIRLQCLRARGEWQRDHLEREQALLARHRWDWIGLPEGGMSEGWGSWGFRRGFPECLWVEMPTLSRRHRDFARVVWLREVCLQRAQPAEVARLPQLEWGPNWVNLRLEAEGLFREHATPSMLRALAECPRAGRLERLTLSGFRLSSGAALALTGEPHTLGGLAALTFESCALESGCVPLLRTRFGRRLQITGRRENGEPILHDGLTTTAPT